MKAITDIKTLLTISVPDGIAKLAVNRGTHVYEGEPIPIKKDDAPAYIEQRIRELQEWEARLEEREAALEQTRKRKPKTD